MVLSHKSSAWSLVFLQSLFAFFLSREILDLAGLSFSQIFQGPPWLTILLCLQWGVAILLAGCALWKFEIALLILLSVIHVTCPILFFTDLTRNPYFTQITLLHTWIAFFWLGWSWDCVKNEKFLFPKTPLDFPLAAFLLLASFSFLFSFYSHETRFHASMISEGTKSIFFLIVNSLLIYYAAVPVEKSWRTKFLWITYTIGVITALYGVMQFYGLERIWQSSLTAFANRPVSTFGNPNFLSSYLLLLVPLLIVNFLLEKRQRTSFILFLFLCAVLAGIVSTMTRSTWVGVATSLILLCLSPPVRRFLDKNKIKCAWILLILIAAVLFWPKSKLGGSYAGPLQRVMEIKNVTNPSGYGPWHQRILIWSCAWGMVKDHMILGKGQGLFELFYPYYQGRLLSEPLFRSFRTHANNAHNEILEIWSQSGFLGMGLYFYIWVTILTFGWISMKELQETQPETSLWVWALTAGSLGMFVDNFFGNVSLHFAIPAFLFWWQVGLLFGFRRSNPNGPDVKQTEWFVIPLKKNPLSQSLITGFVLFLVTTCIWSFKKEFQEIYYFKGFKVSKSPALVDTSRSALETAWRWYSREVNTNYELANTYARLSQQSAQMGLTSQTEIWRKKAIWAYLESLRSNCGYDEIYFNLATTQAQIGWIEDEYPGVSIPL
ncbi:MAG: O-antigen ligase family protein, partial [Elusimicrobia bacterium]|nr:O-antigen ligase family protein [Elusimicrobiota bacterium]